MECSHTVVVIAINASSSEVFRVYSDNLIISGSTQRIKGCFFDCFREAELLPFIADFSTANVE